MLLRQHAGCQCCRSVNVQHGHDGLRQNGAVVKVCGHLVYRGTSYLAVGVQGALMAEPVASTPEQFGVFMKNELAKYEKVVKASGAKVD